MLTVIDALQPKRKAGTNRRCSYISEPTKYGSQSKTSLTRKIIIQQHIKQ